MSPDDDRAAKDSTDTNDRRDPAIERAWREASREQPPANVDARILAAARASVGAEEQLRPVPLQFPRRNVLQRWQPMLAAAAVAGLALVLVPMTLSPPVTQRTTAPASSPAVESSDSTPAYDSAAPESTRSREEVGAARSLENPRAPASAPVERALAIPEPVPATTAETRASKAARTVPPPPAAAEAGSSSGEPADAATTEDSSSSASSASGSFGGLDSSAARPRREHAEQAGRMSDTAAASAPTAQAREKSSDDPAPADPRTWAGRVDTAYRRGDLKVAADALRAFRALEPDADAYLADDLRDWARTVR